MSVRDRWFLSSLIGILGLALLLALLVLPQAYPVLGKGFGPHPWGWGLPTAEELLIESQRAQVLSTFGGPDDKNTHVRVTHLATPEPLKGIYITSWIASSKALRDKVVDLIDATGVNAVVIDIKDATGHIAFPVNDPTLKKMGTDSARIIDINAFIAELHERGVYVIGRVAVFQDPLLAEKFPAIAVKRADKLTPWRDRKGIGWVDAGSKKAWDYAIAIARESYSRGFDEINFDYVRFPSDGDMNDIYFPYSEGKERAEVLEGFFSYLRQRLAGTGIVTSADLFGMTTTNKGDLNIGQVLGRALPYFDYVMPMVYPSHYPPGFLNMKNPAAEPYEVVKYSMDAAVAKKALAMAAASTTPMAELRPWLQDFDLGATYTAEMVQAQMRAVYDAGLTSWILWDPKVQYTKGALLADKLAVDKKKAGH